eukprot:TRINITY_DN3001_c0_g1_i1.p1 TRINITY_DN3001_c0_g1~~TRINITY_DN3001_c0_g1_i1.p1  ORF type:complete len:375 (+),score=59.21 TRINITY_DN3001_c0_g1_i1:37-1161(+)
MERRLDDGAITYLREKNVHKLFENMTRHLLKEKPEEPLNGLLEMLTQAEEEKGNNKREKERKVDTLRIDDTLSDTALSTSTFRSISSTRPTAGTKGGKRRQRVMFNEEADCMEITDVGERIHRGEFWGDGEQDAMKENLPPTNECHFCCFEPNDCEWSLFSLYEEPGGDWHLVCSKESCLARVKPWWAFSYTMGDSLSRATIPILRNVLSFVAPEDVCELAEVSADWREAFWSELSFNGASKEKVKLAVQTGGFAEHCEKLIIRNVTGIGGDTVLQNRLHEAACLTEIVITDCGLSLSHYTQLLTALEVSLPSLASIVLGPISPDDEYTGLSTIFSFLTEGPKTPPTVKFHNTTSTNAQNAIRNAAPEGLTVTF